jgi:hypothetical protein
MPRRGRAGVISSRPDFFRNNGGFQRNRPGIPRFIGTPFRSDAAYHSNLMAPGMVSSRRSILVMSGSAVWVKRKCGVCAGFAFELRLAPCSIASRPLRAAARGPVARFDPISARRAQRSWAGMKSGASSRTKSVFCLQTPQRLKNEETARVSRTTQLGRQCQTKRQGSVPDVAGQRSVRWCSRALTANDARGVRDSGHRAFTAESRTSAAINKSPESEQ